MTSIMKIPQDLMMKIVKFLNDECILRIRTVSKTSKQIIDDVIIKGKHPAIDIDSIEFWRNSYSHEGIVSVKISGQVCSKLFVRLALNKFIVDGIDFEGRGHYSYFTINQCTVERMNFLVDLKLQFDHLRVEEIFFHMALPELFSVVTDFLEGSAVHSIGFYDLPLSTTDEQRGQIMKCIEQFKPECVQFHTARDQIHMPIDLLKRIANCGTVNCIAVESMIDGDHVSVKPNVLIPFVTDILNGVCHYLDTSDVLVITMEHVEQIIQKIASMDKKVHFCASVDVSLADMDVQYGHLRVVIDQARFNRQGYKRVTIEHMDGEWHVHG